MSTYNDEEIMKRAQAIAHEHTSACKNRPETMAKGHGKACQRLAKIIAEAMRETRDSVST